MCLNRHTNRVVYIVAVISRTGTTPSSQGFWSRNKPQLGPPLFDFCATGLDTGYFGADTERYIELSNRLWYIWDTNCSYLLPWVLRDAALSHWFHDDSCWLGHYWKDESELARRVSGRVQITLRRSNRQSKLNKLECRCITSKIWNLIVVEMKFEWIFRQESKDFAYRIVQKVWLKMDSHNFRKQKPSLTWFCELVLQFARYV